MSAPDAAAPTLLLRDGDVVPVDAEAVDGQAAVDEAAVTGESAPVLREAVPGRHTVLAGTRLTSGWLRVRPLPSPVIAGRAEPSVPPWWPAAALGFAAAAALLTAGWTGWPRLAALAAAALPLLSLAARPALAAAEAGFWRRLRILPVTPAAAAAAARCDTLLLAEGAVDASGRLVAVAFHPLPPATAEEVAAAAHRAGDGADAEHAVRILARSRGLRAEAVAVREPICGPVARVAAEVALRGGAWPESARASERHICARGARCLAAADGGRPLGLIELRAERSGPSLEDVRRAGLAQAVVHDPAGLDAAAAGLRAQGRRFAVACAGTEARMPPLGATFVLAGTAWGAAHPTALDLDGNVGKLPAAVLGARRLRRRAAVLVLGAVIVDLLRLAVVVRAAAAALRAPAPGWAALAVPAALLAVAAAAGAAAVIAGMRRSAA